MTGIVSVSSLYLIYRILTLVFLHLFGVYDFRHHLIKNTALVFLSLWCLFGILLKLILGIAPSLPLLIFTACLGGSVGFSYFSSLQSQPMVGSVAAISSL